MMDRDLKPDWYATLLESQTYGRWLRLCSCSSLETHYDTIPRNYGVLMSTVTILQGEASKLRISICAPRSGVSGESTLECYKRPC
jgi:hypothetical protein